MKESCPSCDSTEGIRENLYGLPEYPIDETKQDDGGCGVIPNSPNWLCLECGWSGWSLNNSSGTKLLQWKCPICQSIGKIRILGMNYLAFSLARDWTYKAEFSYGERPLNAMCLECGQAAVFVHAYSCQCQDQTPMILFEIRFSKRPTLFETICEFMMNGGIPKKLQAIFLLCSFESKGFDVCKKAQGSIK